VSGDPDLYASGERSLTSAKPTAVQEQCPIHLGQRDIRSHRYCATLPEASICTQSMGLNPTNFRPVGSIPLVDPTKSWKAEILLTNFYVHPYDDEKLLSAAAISMLKLQKMAALPCWGCSIVRRFDSLKAR